MNIVNYLYNCLQSLKNKEYTFSYLLNKKVNSNELDSNMIIPVKDTLKALINRYYFLCWEIKHYLKGILLDEINLEYLTISLAFIRYARNIDSLKIENELFDELKLINSTLDFDKIREMLSELKKNITVLPDVFKDNFSKKVSLNYSYPEWLVSMMRKHFGTKNTFKSISSSRKSVPISICSNDLLVSELDSTRFEKTNTTSNSYFYIGNKKLYEEEAFIKKQIIVLDQSEQKVLEELKIYQGEKILMIGLFDPSFIINTCIKICDLGKVRVACPTYESYINSKNIVSKFKFRSNEIFESSLKLVCTHSENNNDRVIVIPENSELGLVRKKPEVLISFKRERFDELIETQYQTIKEASSFVKNDGELDYIVPTLNKKETYLLVRRFLSENRQFGLIEEQMIFPFDYRGEGIYYARLRKLGN